MDLKDRCDEYFPLYDRFKKYFSYLNTGHKGKEHDIFAYNGGLFAPDEILDNISIDDTLLYEHTQNLSNYDFESEVSVLEKELIRRYWFDSIHYARWKIAEYYKTYNSKGKHRSLRRQTPDQMWNANYKSFKTEEKSMFNPQPLLN